MQRNFHKRRRYFHRRPSCIRAPYEQRDFASAVSQMPRLPPPLLRPPPLSTSTFRNLPTQSRQNSVFRPHETAKFCLSMIARRITTASRTNQPLPSLIAQLAPTLCRPPRSYNCSNRCIETRRRFFFFIFFHINAEIKISRDGGNGVQRSRNYYH